MGRAAMKWIYHDGGRADAGYRWRAGDCVTRAVAIATGIPYREVYDALNAHAERERGTKSRNGRRVKSSARTGVFKQTTRSYITGLGWKWIPTMQIGSGCKVHLRAEELPPGRLIVQVTRHVVAVIDGVAYDTHDPSRDGTRCVYGYYVQTC